MLVEKKRNLNARRKPAVTETFIGTRTIVVRNVTGLRFPNVRPFTRHCDEIVILIRCRDHTIPRHTFLSNKRIHLTDKSQSNNLWGADILTDQVVTFEIRNVKKRIRNTNRSKAFRRVRALIRERVVETGWGLFLTCAFEYIVEKQFYALVIHSTQVFRRGVYDARVRMRVNSTRTATTKNNSVFRFIIDTLFSFEFRYVRGPPVCVFHRLERTRLSCTHVRESFRENNFNGETFIS